MKCQQQNCWVSWFSSDSIFRLHLTKNFKLVKGAKMTDGEAKELFWSQGIPFWGNHFPWVHLCCSQEQNVALDWMLAQSLQTEIPQNSIASSASVPSGQLYIYILNNRSGKWMCLQLEKCGSLWAQRWHCYLIGKIVSRGLVGENG